MGRAFPQVRVVVGRDIEIMTKTKTKTTKQLNPNNP